MNSDAFKSFLGRLNGSLSESSPESVDQLTATYWPTLTRAQREQVQALYDQYGWVFEYGV